MEETTGETMHGQMEIKESDVTEIRDVTEDQNEVERRNENLDVDDTRQDLGDSETTKVIEEDSGGQKDDVCQDDRTEEGGSVHFKDEEDTSDTKQESKDEMNTNDTDEGDCGNHLQEEDNVDQETRNVEGESETAEQISGEPNEADKAVEEAAEQNTQVADDDEKVEGNQVNDTKLKDTAPDEFDQNEDTVKKPPKSAASKKSTSSKKSKTVRVRSGRTISTIDINISRIMDRDDDEDSDTDDVVAMVTTNCAKSVDFSIPMDDVDAELQRVLDRPGSGRTSMMDNEDMIGLGRAATLNTPVTINDDRESNTYNRSIRTPSRDGIYEHAVSLMQSRCRSTSYGQGRAAHAQQQRRRQTAPPGRSVNSLPAALLGGVPMFSLPNVVEHINDQPFTDQPNSYFYIAQNRPLPMKPIKVWKGYRSNVYFEPMVCRSVQLTPASKERLENPANHTRRVSSRLTRFPEISGSTEQTTGGESIANLSRKSTKSAGARSEATTGRRTAMTGTKSAMSSRSNNPRQMAILDKSSVLNQLDYNAAEDITWINGIESTGTLRVGPARDRSTARFYQNTDKHYKLRICRGLVSHALAVNSKNSPALGVSGGRINEDQANQENSKFKDRRHKNNVNDDDNDDDGGGYQYVDTLSKLEQLVRGHRGRSEPTKLIHILPSATSDSSAAPMLRAKGK